MKNYGYIAPVRKEKDYVLGRSSLPTDIINPTGDWTPYLPIYEPQKENFDTYGCTVFGSQNLIETYIKFLKKDEPNYSERFTYIMAGVRPPGADPFHVAETIRKTGLANQEVLPMTDTFPEFIQPDPMPEVILQNAKLFLDKYEFGYEYVGDDVTSIEERKKLITDTLKISPLGVALYAWEKDKNGLYYRYQNRPDTHWCTLVAEKEDYYVIFDSYDHGIKHVRKDMNIQIVMRIYVKEKLPIETPVKKVPWYIKLYNWFFVEKLRYREFKLWLIKYYNAKQR